MMVRLAALSALLTFLLFLGVRDNGFVALDDFAYIVENPHIASFDWSTVWWAGTAFHEGNWHPLTMISLALDHFAWGLTPFGFHLTNILIHSCTVFTVCFVYAALLNSVVQNDCRSRELQLFSEKALPFAAAAGALFFGVHPLRVESVAWASERKDVLCLFFLITSIWWYLRYVQQRCSCSNAVSHHFKSYWVSLLLAVMALMSKPTAVSLPFVLLILDWYPLGRLSDRQGWKRSLLEKVPFLLVSSIGVLLTLAAQQVAIDKAPEVDFASRLLVACKALLFYLVKTAWPSDLAAFYMHPGNVAESDFGMYLLYVCAVIALCLIAVAAGRRTKMWPALGLFYLITLAPMVGLVQVGGQWAADRYSYLPALGLSLVWGGGVAWCSTRLRRSGHILAMNICISLAVCQLAAYSVQTVRQIAVWKDTDTLATRIIELMPHQSGAAYYARANYRYETGKYEPALEDITEAMKIALRGNLRNNYAALAMLQARVLDRLGRSAEALSAADWAVETSDSVLPIDFLTLRIELSRKVAAAEHSSGRISGGR